jgi:hypothetical protein
VKLLNKTEILVAVLLDSARLNVALYAGNVVEAVVEIR